MDIEAKIELITRSPAEEIILPEELRSLLETEAHPIAYGGWEPSGPVHLGTGLVCAYKMKDLIGAGVRFKAYLATWHAWMNNKLGGDMAKIRLAAEHFRHSWIACGVPEDKIEFIWPEQEYDDLEYWQIVVNAARHLTVARVTRTLEIAGRKSTEALNVAHYMYTPMQVADIFRFGVRIAQLGMDQRKANVVAREIGPALGFWKPVCVHHHLLQGLAKPAVWPLPSDPAAKKEALSAVKMSKSKPNTCVFTYDEPDAIRAKISGAFCPEKQTEFNPILDIARQIVFHDRQSLKVNRPAKFGGPVEFGSADELERAFAAGSLHPMDLKSAVAESLVEILEPVRTYFAKHKKAAEGRDMLMGAQITR